VRASAAFFWLNRVCAVVLLAGLALHLWIQHFSEPSVHINFDRVVALLRHPFLFYLDGIILIAALYKALYGVRSVLYDFSALHRIRRVVDYGLVAAGLVLATIGINTLARISGFLR
jgi:succinate dehydrogenase hydrophobic anchor subunit